MSVVSEAHPWSALLDLGRTDGRIVREAFEGARAVTEPLPGELHPALLEALDRTRIQTPWSRLQTLDLPQTTFQTQALWYELHDDLLARDFPLEVLLGSLHAAEQGCPSCVQSPKSGNLSEPLAKAGALEMLARMLER